MRALQPATTLAHPYSALLADHTSSPGRSLVGVWGNPTPQSLSLHSPAMQSSLAGPVMDGSSPLASTSSAASDATATAAASRSERVRQRAENAKKKMQRVVHERAPGISTLVAGHEDTKYSLHNKIYTYAPLRSSSNHANGYSSSSPSLHLAPPGSSGLGPSSHRRHPKRYSAQEVQRLVPDELGELHDPEYERIRMVSPIAMDKERRRRRRRKLKAQQKDNPAGLGTVQGADGDGNSIASGSIASSSAASSSSDSSSSAGSSDDDEDPEGSEVSSTMSKLPSGAVRRTAQLGGGFSSATSTTMSITSAAHPTATSSLSTSSPYRYVPSYERYRNASLNTLAPSQPKTLQGFTTSLAAHHKSSQQQARIMRQLQREQERMEAGSNSNSDSRSDRLHPDTTATSSIYNRSSFSTLRPPSIITTTHSSEYSGDQASSRRSTARTYADAGVTYLAPSITMPPVAPSGRSSYTGSGGVSTSGTYNPVS